MRNKKFLSTTELAKMLGISRVAVFKRIKTGKIKAEKIGRDFVIDINDIAEAPGRSLTEKRRGELDKAIEKTIREYGETLRLLGRE